MATAKGGVRARKKVEYRIEYRAGLVTAGTKWRESTLTFKTAEAAEAYRVEFVNPRRPRSTVFGGLHDSRVVKVTTIKEVL